jgi:hypothetical protein
MFKISRTFILAALLFTNIRCIEEYNRTADIKTAKPGKSGTLTSQVRLYNGTPALYINGNLTSQVLAAPYRPGASDFNDFLKAGISIFDIYLRFDWTAPEQYDFTKVDQKLEFYLKIDPNVLFLPRVLLTPGQWWCKEFPAEITMRDDGSPAGMFGPPCHPSLASAKYRELSHKAMIAFINHVEEKFGDHIVGYQAGNGFGGEWLMFNSFWEVRPGAEPPTRFGVEDYSPPAQAAFRQWLKKKYRGSVDELRLAWGNPKVTFENAAPPDEVERYSSTHGIFFDPAVSRRVPDYFSFFNDMTADVLLENCRWIKELTNHKKIVGSFYGYLWCNFPNLSVNHSGHLGLAKVLDSPDVDFIASPYTYDNKEIGGPDNSQTLPEDALMHGKLYFNEVDTETHLHQRQWRWGNCLNLPKNFDETKALLIRDYGYALTKGFGMWWTDLRGSNFHDDQIIKLLSDLKKIDLKYLTADKRSNADIAVILDEETYKYFGDGEPLFNALLTAQKQWQLGFIGAPWEPYLLTDIDNPKMKDFKLYIFLNTFHVTAQQRDAIHKRLKRNGATAIWVYAPGYITDKKLSIEQMSALTGIRLAESNSVGELRVKVTNFEHPYTKSLPKDFVYGTDVDVNNIIRWYDHQVYLKDPRDPSLRRDLPGFRISPRFYCDDPQAVILGTLAGLNKPGLAVKKQQGGWTSIYSSAPILPAALIRNILRAAGGHVYSNANDVVYANKNTLCIYSPAGKFRMVHLPQKSKVIDLLDGKILADGALEFPLALAPNSSILLGLEPPTKPTKPGIFHSFLADKDVEPTADPNSKFWRGIKPLIIDRTILGVEAPALRSEVRSRWTKDNIYFLFSGPYENLTLKPNPDTKNETFRLWQWDVFEIYIGTDFEHINLYKEFQVSPQAEFLDLNIDSTKQRPGYTNERFWNSGFKVKTTIDKNKKVWYAEMKIPTSPIDKRPAKVGNTMRVNIFRLQGSGNKRDFLAWQPTGLWNPHRPEYFGTLKLVDGL